MTPEHDPRRFHEWDDATLDRAFEAFLEGGDADEFDGLQADLDGAELAEIEQTIAAIQWTHAAAPDQVEQPPEALMQSLKAQAEGWIAAQEAATDGVDAPAESEEDRWETGPSAGVLPMPRRTPRKAWKARKAWMDRMALVGWAAAAALLVVLMTRERPFAEPAPAPDAQFDSLVARANDLVRIAWAPTEDPAAATVQGEVVWSDAEQEGYMVLEGLPVNNPTETQYQLWMFDPGRAEWEKLPVDGGVFDIAQDGKTVVPIEAKLPVHNVALFAITIEKPGGVVVSERERLVVTASAS